MAHWYAWMSDHSKYSTVSGWPSLPANFHTALKLTSFTSFSNVIFPVIKTFYHWKNYTWKWCKIETFYYWKITLENDVKLTSLSELRKLARRESQTETVEYLEWIIMYTLNALWCFLTPFYLSLIRNMRGFLQQLFLSVQRWLYW